MAEFVLVGGPAVGKTTVGALLARRLGVDFFDADEQIELRAGKPISQIFAEQGEPSFRALEYEVIQELLDQAGVLSLGGGAVLNEDLRNDLRAPQYRVIWLRCAAAGATRRVGDSTHRPLLAGQDVEHRVTQLHASRAPLYAQVADFSVDTDDLEPAQVVEVILTEVAK